MQAVHVLRRIHGVQHALGIDMLGEGKLDQDAVHIVAGVELVHDEE